MTIPPYSDGLKGIEAAIWLGILGGDAELGLAVLSSVSRRDIDGVLEIIGGEGSHTTVELLDSPPVKLHLWLEGTGGRQPGFS